jgi:heptosyltransferase II
LSGPPQPALKRRIGNFGRGEGATGNVTASAVIQVKRGIGDVIWHLPFVRAIAAAAPGGQVTFLAPPSSGARELLAAEPCVAETVYFEHSGSELRRAVNFIRLVALLRQRRFRTLWILDRTIRPASAAFLAGIPERIGVGLTRQRWFLTNPGIDQSHFHDHPIGWSIALLAAANVPLPSTEPNLRVPADALATISAKYADCPRPWIAVGLGGSHPTRDWPDDRWATLVAGMRARGAGSIFIVGGPENAARAERLVAQGSGVPAVNACGLKLGETVALLRHADLFVGTDSGPMNIAAAVGTPAFALFGVNRVLTYSKFIHPIVPEGGPAPDGMARIAPADVLERIAPSLSVCKQRR